MRIEQFQLRRSPGFADNGLKISASKISAHLNIVYGPNGSGKTTLATCFTAIFYPDSVVTWPFVAFSAELSTKVGVRSLHQEGKHRFIDDGGSLQFSQVGLDKLLHFSLEEIAQASDQEFAAWLHKEMMGGYSFQEYREGLNKLEVNLKPLAIKARIKQLENSKKQELERQKALEQDRLALQNANLAVDTLEIQIDELRQQIHSKVSCEDLSLELDKLQKAAEKLPPLAFSLTIHTKELCEHFYKTIEETKGALSQFTQLPSLEKLQLWQTKAMRIAQLQTQLDTLEEKLAQEKHTLASALAWLNIEPEQLNKLDLAGAKNLQELLERKKKQKRMPSALFWVILIALFLLTTTLYFATKSSLAFAVAPLKAFFALYSYLQERKEAKALQEALAQYKIAEHLQLTEVLPLYMQASQKSWDTAAIEHSIKEKKAEMTELQAFFHTEQLPTEPNLLASLCREKMHAVEQKEHLRQKLAETSGKLQALLQPFGASYDDEVLQAVPLAHELKTKIDEIKARLSSYPVSSLEDLEKGRKELHRLEQKRNETLEKRGKFLQNVESTLKEGKLAALQEQLAQEKQKFQAAKNSFIEVQVGHFLIQQIQKKCEENSQSILFQTASQNVAKLTLNRYSLKSPEKDQGQTQFYLYENETGKKRNLKQLSHASRIQVIVAIRLALLAQIEDPEDPFPLFFDETIATGDEERMEVFIELCKELSQTRQVFYFTSRFVDAVKWQANIISLVPMPDIIPQVITTAKQLIEAYPGESLFEYAYRLEGLTQLRQGSVAWILPDIATYQRALQLNITKIGHFFSRSWNELTALEIMPQDYEIARQKAYFLQQCFALQQKNRRITLDLFDELELEPSTLSKLRQLLEIKEHDPYQVCTALHTKDSALKGVRGQTLEKIMQHLKLQGFWKETEEKLDPYQELLENSSLDTRWCQEVIAILWEKTAFVS